MTANLSIKFEQARNLSERLCEHLAVEDYGLQAIPETSPAKWHLAHTSWFFETFILKAHVENYQVHHPQFEVLFNSYYNSIGEQHPRAERGVLSRPTVAEVIDYRHTITEKMLQLLQLDNEEVNSLTELGINHEQQHQELFFTDLKYNFSRNPLYPAYASKIDFAESKSEPLEWLCFKGGIHEMGYGGDDFCFDNETPTHSVLLQDFAIANRLVSNGDYRNFIADGGYQRPELWLADGWATVQQYNWQQPLYWQQQGQDWYEFTLYGLQPLLEHLPACHLSAYEADAFCRWSGNRLPSEQEWEHVAKQQKMDGQFLEQGTFHPLTPLAGQLHGSLWQWTSSAYSPYPGYQADTGAVGEYNGKFMSNQLVLRGGSCVTSQDHMRSSYRNFFYPPDRWQFSGIRMAQWR